MKILYISSVPSQKEFIHMKEMLKYGVNNASYGMQESGFKFHTLILKGLSEDKNNSILNLVGRPVSRKTHKNLFWKSNKETEDNLSYYHLSLINIPIVKQIYICIAYFKEIIKWLLENRKNNDKIIIIDGAYITIIPILLLATKFIKCKKIAIVCDVYEYMAEVKDARDKKQYFHKLIRKYINNNYKKIDGFIFIAEAMNDVINPIKNPYIVMEGLVDHKMKTEKNLLKNKFKEQVIIYAGSLKVQYGIRNLVRGFLNYKNDNARLWIYGNGDYRKDLEKNIKKDPRIKYFGIKPNNEVVKNEIKATLLINPRPINQEFTKYSFPSKNMEYMVSGTPVLTTRLPGMPKEYYDYIYLIDSDDEKGITIALKKIFSLNKEELHEKGLTSKEFVLYYKNNLVQAKRIIEFANQIVGGNNEKNH